MKPRFRMTARGPREAEILLYGDVGEWLGGVSAAQFHSDLRALGAVSTLRLRINSMGGDAFDGLAIYQQLKQHPARKVVEIDALAASIASVIAMAGDEIRIARSAELMIHEAAGRAAGPSGKMREIAERLESVTATLADVYAQRTKQPVSQIREWMAAGGGVRGTYFTAAEAVRLGFADAIAEAERIAAHYDPERHIHVADVPTNLIGPPPSRPERDAMAARLAEMRLRVTKSAARGG